MYLETKQLEKRIEEEKLNIFLLAKEFKNISLKKYMEKFGKHEFISKEDIYNSNKFGNINKNAKDLIKSINKETHLKIWRSLKEDE